MPMFRKSMIVLLLLALVAGGGALYGMKSSEDATVLDSGAREMTSSGASESEGSITVYVTGAVNQPGVVDVPSNARVADAVNACGGHEFTADIAEDAIHLECTRCGSLAVIPAKTADDLKQLQPGCEVAFLRPDLIRNR